MPAARKATNVKFEAAMEALERIVGEMEDAELPLDKLVERYEEGMKLARVCEEKLSEAEKKVEVLTSHQSPEKTASESKKTPEPDEDVSLF